MNRVPPNNPELERAVLGSLLFAPEAPLPDLSPEHFYRGGNRVVFDAILSLRARGETADLVSVTAHLHRAGALEKAGGAAYVSSLTDAVYVQQIDQHAAKLLDLWRLRQAIVRAREIESSAYTADSVADVASRFSGAAAELAPRSPRMAAAQQGVTEAVASIEAAWSGTGHPGYTTGYADLDAVVRVSPQDLVIVAGRPGMGKSAWAVGMAVRGAEAEQKTAYFSLEMSREALWKRALSAHSGVPLEGVRSGLVRDDQWSALSRSAGSLQSLPLWIDDSPGASIGYIEGQAQRIRDQHGLDVVLIDHLHRMRERGRYSAQREMYDEILIRAKNLAKSLHCAVVLLAQLNRGVEDRSPPRPWLSDLRETGRIEEEADTVLMLYRPEYYLRGKCPAEERGVGYVQIEKQRDGKSGMDVRLTWRGEHAAYGDLTRG